MGEDISTATECKFIIAAAGYGFEGGELLLLVFVGLPGPQHCLRIIDAMEVYALNGHGVFIGGRRVYDPEAQGGL